MNFNDIAHGIKSLISPPTIHAVKAGVPVTSASVLNTQGWPVGSPTKQWLDLYSENPRLAVVHKISEDNGATQYYIKSKTRRSEFYVDNHPFAKEIEKHSVPNFFALWTAYYLMKGIVYIAYDLEAGKPVNFKIFTTVHVVKSEDDNRFVFQYGKEQKSYPKNQVIIDTDLDLNNPYFNGKGKAEAIKDEIETDEFVQKYIKYFYINSARPDVFITAEKGEEMSEADVVRLESEWLKKFQGVNNAHKPVFLNWAAQVTSVPSSHKDMELLDTRKFYRDTSIQHFGVPPEIMGIVENSNKATVIAAEHIYAQQVRMPKLGHMALIVNTQILPLYGDATKMEFYFENIIPDDVELTLKIVGEGLQNRVLVVNEWRTAMGYPKIKGDYGNSIVGSKQQAGSELPVVVEVESEDLDARDYKDYKDIVSKDFLEYAEALVGKDLSGELTIIIPDAKEEKNDKGTKKPSKV